MSIEGNLRDLALLEVCQLLALTRKTGGLRVYAPLSGMTGSIMFDGGAIVGASLIRTPPSSTARSHADRADSLPNAPADLACFDRHTAPAVERTVLELLAWRDGEFRFTGGMRNDQAPGTPVRLNTELLPPEGTRQVEAWKQFADRIPHSRVVPAFADVDPRAMPPLALSPQQWEVLMHVDGERNLQGVAVALGRNVLWVAAIVHELLVTGLLRLVAGSRTVRTQATPPSSDAIANDDDERGWVPSSAHRARGDAAMRLGRFPEAIAHWHTALTDTVAGGDAGHAREAILLASRLQELLGGGGSR